MREEITEPQHWRASTQRNRSWSLRRRTHDHAELAAEAVDAALAQEFDAALAQEFDAALPDEADQAETLNASDIISSLSSQLDLLERQREQLQRLLDQAKSS